MSKTIDDAWRTAYVPMPQRLRATLTGDGAALRDLTDLVRPACGATSIAAERALERHFGGARVLLTDSGSSALVLALRHVGVGAGDEVILASFNCPQVAQAVLATGATPVLADCDPDTGALDPASVRRLITGKTKCLVLTHQFGHLPGTQREVLEIAKAHGVKAIDDSAQALGARLDGVRAGRLGDAGVLSFGRTKPLSCFGGGALILPPGVFPPALTTAAQGTARPAVRASYEQFVRGQAKPVRYALTRAFPLLPLQTDVAQALETRLHGIGLPRPMHPRSARLLARKLARLEITMAARRAAARRLARELAGLPLGLPPVDAEEYSASCFAVTLKPESRFALGDFLSRRGFQTCWFHYPLHRLGRYRRFARGEFPGTEHLWPRLLVLPHRQLSPRMAEELGRTVHDFFGG